MRDWTVAGALIAHGDGLVLVGNRRRSGALEWTPPGGVIDEGEAVLDGLAREVHEETGLRVTAWGSLAYTVRVDAPGLGWRMHVEAWEVAATDGDIVLADPDGIVEEVRHLSADGAAELLGSAPAWVREPVMAWLAGTPAADFHFALHGTTRDDTRVERLR